MSKLMQGIQFGISSGVTVSFSYTISVQDQGQRAMTISMIRVAFVLSESIKPVLLRVRY